MREVYKNGHDRLWIEALEAKYEQKGKAWSTNDDFDRILIGYQVIAARRTIVVAF